MKDNPSKIDVRQDAPEVNYLGEEAEPRGNRLWWILAIIVAILAIAGAAYAMSASGEEETDEAAESEQVPSVTVIIPGRGNVERLISATGTLAARREMPVGVAGEGGQVSRVLVEQGSWVQQGQVLAIIDKSVQSQQTQSAAAQIDVAMADARLAQSNLDRALKLVDRGFISKADVDRLTATRDAANARVNVARAQRNELKARSSRLNITAPSAGLVLERNVEPGQVVSAGSGVLFRLAKGGEMELQAQLSENDLMNISTGVTAKVTPVGSNETFTGQVWQIAPVINPESRQGIARIALSYNAALRPGGFASAEIVSGSSVAPLLPESAVQSDSKGSYVYIIGQDNKIVRRDIKTGTVTANGIVVNEGLNGSERVVLYAAGFLNPGEVVNPKLQKEQPDRSAPTAPNKLEAAKTAPKAADKNTKEPAR